MARMYAILWTNEMYLLKATSLIFKKRLACLAPNLITDGYQVSRQPGLSGFYTVFKQMYFILFINIAINIHSPFIHQVEHIYSSVSVVPKWYCQQFLHPFRIDRASGPAL